MYLHATPIDANGTGLQQSPIDVVYFIVPLGQPDGGAMWTATFTDDKGGHEHSVKAK